MKISKFLMAGAFTLASFGANAATYFNATDGDINVLDVTLTGGYQLYMADAADSDTLLIPTPSIIGVAGPINAAGDFSATNQNASAIILNGPNPMFSFQVSLDGTNFVEDVAWSNLGANAGRLSFSVGDGSVLLVDVQQVPIPAAAWLFGSGLIGLAGIARRKKASA